MKCPFQLGDLVRTRSTAELGIVIKVRHKDSMGGFDVMCLNTTRQDPILEWCLPQFFALVSRAEQ